MKGISNQFRFHPASFVGAAIVLGLSIPVCSVVAAPVAQPTLCASVLNVAASMPTPVEKRISDLHARLQITHDQEPLWQSVAQVMRDNASAMDALRQTHNTNMDNMSAVESLRSYGEMIDAHADGIKKLTPAFQALYNSMSKNQQHNADLIFRKEGHHPAKQG